MVEINASSMVYNGTLSVILALHDITQAKQIQKNVGKKEGSAMDSGKARLITGIFGRGGSEARSRSSKDVRPPSPDADGWG